MFHHDSPYDACSPQFNRGKRTAPVRAFDRSVDPLTQALLESHQQCEGGIPDAEEHSREQLHELSEMSANQDSAGINGYVDPNTAEGELMGAGAEPWQEFHNTSPYQRKATASSSSQPQEFGDMETILKGGRRRADNTISRNDTSELPTESDDIMAVSQKEGTADMRRSKSLLGRFRRLKVDPEEVARLEGMPHASLSGASRENQVTRVPQASAPLSTSTAPTTETLPIDSAGATAGQTGPSVLPLQPEAKPRLSQRKMTSTLTSPLALNAPPPPPPKESALQESLAATSQPPSRVETGASEGVDRQDELPSRGGSIFRRFTLQRRRPAAR